MTLKALKRHKRIVMILRILLAIVIIGLWEVCARLGIINAFIFSSPSRIVNTAIEMLQRGTLLKHIGVTLSETLISFAIITVAGILIAIILWLFNTAFEVTEPLLVLLNSLPKSALAPVLIVWLGNNPTTIIVTGISVAIFGTIITICTCFKDTDPDKIFLIKTLGGNRLQLLTKVVLPGSVPSIISTMKVNIGLCLVGVIIGEFLAAKEGLGYLIIYGSQVFKLDWVMMSITILCVISIILYKIIGLVEKRFQDIK